MIFVDTSVWIAAFRQAAGPEAHHLRELLDQDEVALPIVVRLEILAGASRQDRPKLRKILSVLPTFYPAETTWPLIESWIEQTSAAGQNFGFGDLLIGALAKEQDASVWSLDSDFGRLASLGLIIRHSPTG